jgi:AcrR family transcriptional regulator
VSDQQGKEVRAGGLGRLPPGRHGLPREFVEQNQRDRLTAAVIAVVAERGYRDATITQIAAAAGVSRRTFYSRFSSKEESFFDAYDVIAAHIRERARAAAAEHEDWIDRARAKMATLLEIFAANPDLAKFCLIAPRRAGEEIAGRYTQGIGEAYEAMVEVMPPEMAGHAPSREVQQSLIGGMAALLVDRVEAGQGDRLMDLLPDILAVFLVPYVGREEAFRAASRSSGAAGGKP